MAKGTFKCKHASCPKLFQMHWQQVRHHKECSYRPQGSKTLSNSPSQRADSGQFAPKHIISKPATHRPPRASAGRWANAVPHPNQAVCPVCQEILAPADAHYIFGPCQPSSDKKQSSECPGAIVHQRCLSKCIKGPRWVRGQLSFPSVFACKVGHRTPTARW